MGDVCAACTLTDIKRVPESLAAGDAEKEVDYSRAYLLESHSQHKYVMKGPRCRIGRDPSNQVVIGDDAYASRFHAWISYEDGHYFVEDLGSTNGTLLNGSPLTRRRPIISGDRLRVGRSDFTFIVDPAAPMGSVAGAAAERQGQNEN